MAITQSGRLSLQINSDLVSTVDLSTVTDRLRKLVEAVLANGTGASQANNVFHDTRPLTTGANEDLDLSGALVNVFGQTLSFTKIKLILIAAAPGNTTNLTISRPANGLPLFAASGDALAALKPGGVFLFVDPSDAGIPVTDGTAERINIANAAGATANYDVVIIGVT